MNHVRCVKCNVTISKVQRDSHFNMCGICYWNSDTTDIAKGILVKLSTFARGFFHG